MKKVKFQGVTMYSTNDPSELPKVIKPVKLTKKQVKFFAKMIVEGIV